MSQTLFAANTTPSLTLLDQNFTQLYDLRELFTTPGYAAATPKIALDSSGRFSIGSLATAAAELLQLEKSTTVPRMDFARTGIGTWHVGGPAVAGNTFEISFNAASPVFWSDGTNVRIGGATVTSELLALEKSTTIPRLQFLRTAVGAWQIGGPATAGNTFEISYQTTAMLGIDNSGNVSAGTDNAQTLGTAAKRWSVVYAGTGTINTSDAREKTAVVPLADAELEAAKQLAREIGSFQFLNAVAAKGDGARLHIGLTVQRAMDVMRGCGLDPLRYAFICHDVWPAQAIEHPAEMEDHPTLIDATGAPLKIQVKAAWLEHIPGGDRYGLRPDELLLFIARGQEARLAALEARS